MIVRHLAWSPGVTVEPLDGNRCRIRSPRRELLTEPLSLAQKGALDTLKGTGVPEAAFLSPIAGVQSRMRLAMYRSEGVRLGLIQQALVADEQLTCGVVSIADRYRPEHELDIPSRPVLSRFTLLRPHGDHFVLESPLSLVQIHLYDQGCLAWLGFLLPGSSTSNELAAEASAQERALLEMLATANMLSNRLVDGRTEEETDETMRQWQFHDLYFHSRSREGRTPEAVGGTYRFGDSIAPLPVRKAPMSRTIVALPKPDLAGVTAGDPPFTTVLEGRRSKREERDQPPSLSQLGEFLFRTARVQEEDVQAGVSWRPYPSGGARHELEIYVAVHQCTGLESDLYNYDAAGHQLERLTVDSDLLGKMLSRSAAAQGAKDWPQVLLLVTARFQRVSWKYSAIAYATTLKNLGGLMQTMYLVATAMEMAPCAVGAGDTDLFGRLADLDQLVEGLVGEFTLR